MSNLITTSITSALTTYLVTYTAPTAPAVAVPDYGSDISCTDDTDELFSDLAGDNPRVVAESVWRSITSPRGSIPGAPNDGWDIQSLLRTAATASEQRTWPRLVMAEITKDDRVATASVKFKQENWDTWSVTIEGTTVEEGTFLLVGTLTADSAVLKEILAS